MPETSPDLSRPTVAFARALDVLEADCVARGVALGPEVARLVGVSRQAVHQVLRDRGGRWCPIGWAVPLSSATGVLRSDLRPDVYPVADEPARRAAARVSPPSPVALERAGQMCIPGTERKRSNV